MVGSWNGAGPASIENLQVHTLPFSYRSRPAFSFSRPTRLDLDLTKVTRNMISPVCAVHFPLAQEQGTCLV